MSAAESPSQMTPAKPFNITMMERAVLIIAGLNQSWDLTCMDLRELVVKIQD